MRKCTECSAEFAKANPGRFPLTCSEGCKKAREKRLRLEAKSYQKTCKICSTEFTATNTRRMYCSIQCKSKQYGKYLKVRRAKAREERPDFVEQPCHYCNQPVWKLATRGGIVSHPICKDAARRDRNRQKNSKRRNYRYISQSKFMEISIRDEWTCHLCGEQVDETLPRLAAKGASLDHVIPLSKGGTDDPENLKLAHFICNVRKGNKVA